MVYINGGFSFPFLTQSYPIRYRPGLTVYEALRETGLVTFAFNGQPTSVGNVHLGGPVHYSISVNGKPIPPAFLNAPLQPGDRLQMYVLYR
jgi:sorbitol-specific phosphotransferase system component IIA